METLNQTSHQRLELKAGYASATVNIEKVLNRLDPKWSKNVESDPEGVVNHLKTVAGKTGLMIFGDQPHGKLLKLKGKSPLKAMQYTIGNPLTAIEMTQYDIRAALYAPFRVIIYEAEDGKAYIEFDLPSSQFGQFGADVLAVAEELDNTFFDMVKILQTLNL